MNLINFLEACRKKSGFYLSINDVKIGVDMMNLPYQGELETELEFNSQK